MGGIGGMGANLPPMPPPRLASPGSTRSRCTTAFTMRICGWISSILRPRASAYVGVLKRYRPAHRKIIIPSESRMTPCPDTGPER